LRIAHQISDRIVEKYGSDILASYVCGSTSKKLDRPFSDLELIVVVRDQAEISMKYYLHQGLIIQIEYLKSSDTLAAAERLTDNWPWEADQYRNRIALYERDGWFRKLDEAVERNDKAATVEAIRKSFLMMTESMAVMRNAMLTKDTVGILSRGRVLAEDAARIVLLLNRRYVTTTSWLWKIVFDLRTKPKDFKELVEKMSGFVPTTREEVVASSERLYKEMSELVTQDGVGIECDDLWVWVEATTLKHRNRVLTLSHSCSIDSHALLRGVTSLHYPAEIPCDERFQRWLLGDALIQLERSILWWMMSYESPLTRASSRPWDASTPTRRNSS
jgi:kanamycin nucleotidyltransferase